VPWTDTDTKVVQTAKTDDITYKILLGANANPMSGTAYEAAYYTGLTFNPSSKTLSISDGTTTGTLTATQYSGTAAQANAVAWIGVSDKPNTLSGYGITDAKISDNKIILGSNEITPVTSVNGHSGSSVTVTASDLGLEKALHFVGETSTSIIDNATTSPITINSTNYTPA